MPDTLTRDPDLSFRGIAPYLAPEADGRVYTPAPRLGPERGRAPDPPGHEARIIREQERVQAALARIGAEREPGDPLVGCRHCGRKRGHHPRCTKRQG